MCLSCHSLNFPITTVCHQAVFSINLSKRSAFHINVKMQLQFQLFQQVNKYLFSLTATSVKAICLLSSLSVSVSVKTLRNSQYSTFSVTFLRYHRNVE